MITEVQFFHSIVDHLLEVVASMRLGFHFMGVGGGASVGNYLVTVYDAISTPQEARPTKTTASGRCPTSTCHLYHLSLLATANLGIKLVFLRNFERII